MISIEAIEAAIVEKLTTGIPSVRVIVFPDSPSDLQRFTGHTGNQILVGFQGEELGAPVAVRSPTHPIQQSWQINFEITLRSKSLRDSHTSIMGLMGQVKTLLTGIQLTDYPAKTYLSGFQWGGKDDGAFWNFSSTLTVQTDWQKAID